MPSTLESLTAVDWLEDRIVMRETHYEHQNHSQQFVGGDDRGLVNSIANSQFGWIGFFLAISPTFDGKVSLRVGVDQMCQKQATY
jgi:hypothetical protein